VSYTRFNRVLEPYKNHQSHRILIVALLNQEVLPTYLVHTFFNTAFREKKKFYLRTLRHFVESQNDGFSLSSNNIVSV